MAVMVKGLLVSGR
jgi:hypothetical protein